MFYADKEPSIDSEQKPVRVSEVITSSQFTLGIVHCTVKLNAGLLNQSTKWPASEFLPMQK